MPFSLERNEDCYVLDFLVDGKGLRIPALTEKNKRFIEGIVKLDSQYARDSRFDGPSQVVMDYLENENNFNIDENENSIPQGDKGSIPFWFKAIDEGTTPYKVCIRGAMLSINASNSTRVSTHDIIVLANRLTQRFSDKNQLIDALNVDFTAENDNHILSILLNKENNSRYELSFSSKFCAYASIGLNTNFQYAKYDKVVSQNLHYYIGHYLGETIEEKFSINNYTRGDQYEHRRNVYFRYNEYIGKIIQKLEQGKDSVTMTKEQLDHIIWYGLKGKNNYDM